MSNIYIQEPPASGKVLLETSVGDIDVELWCRETPKACRNFIQLCLEGYYDNTIFHRVVPGFIAQGGDPTGTGEGGESVYGKPFRDEFHSRLRFMRRGLLAMANAGRNDNGSQFFFTLDATPELQNKHTVFGKVVGNTLFNMIKLADAELQDERPLYPHRIIRTEVLLNPFDDIVPRRSRENEAAADKSRDDKPKSKSSATKNFKLLSFGDEAEEDEEQSDQFSKNLSSKSKSSHDLANDPKLSSQPAVSEEREQLEDKSEEQSSLETLRKKLKKDVAPESSGSDRYRLFQDHDSEMAEKVSQAKTEYAQLKKSMQKKPEKTSPPRQQAASRREDPALDEYHQQLDSYEKNKKNKNKKGKSREKATMALLDKFKSKLVKIREEHQNEEDTMLQDNEEADPNDPTWMWHQMRCDHSGPVLARDASVKQDDWYDIYDPRNDMNKRRRLANQHKP